jgi:uncharacterized protein YvpB
MEEKAIMRLIRVGFAALMSVILGFSALGMTPTAANSVDAWMTVQTNHPAVGCVVDTSVEVRSGGSPLVGAEVTIVLSDDASASIISSMSTTTSQSGIAWLTFNTSGAPGTKTWLELHVNGTYLGGRTIWVDGNTCSGAPSILDLSGEVPSVSDRWVPPASNTSVDSSSGGTFLTIVTYAQQRPLSCEYAAVQIATGMIGYTVSEYQMEAVTPLHANPHWGYRGDINAPWGNTTDYGIYADALIPGLNHYGYSATSFYGGPGEITAAIDQGNPVLVWLGMRGDQSHDEHTQDGTRYQVTAYMHVMVVYGYDDSGVYLSDPGTGGTQYYDWSKFTAMWDIIDGMGLIIGD